MICEIPSCPDIPTTGWRICEFHIQRYFEEHAATVRQQERKTKQRKMSEWQADTSLDAPLIAPINIPHEYQQSWSDELNQYILIRRNKKLGGLDIRFTIN